MKTLSLCLALFSAASAQAALNSPEATLLTQATIVAGQKHSDAERQKLVEKMITNYDETAPQEGREDRMVSALQEMNIMTAARAEEFRAQLDQSMNAQVAANKGASEALKGAMLSLRNSNNGAQYSSCGTQWALTALTTAAAVGSFYEYGQLSKNDYDYSGSNGYNESYHNPKEVLPLLAGVGFSIAATCLAINALVCY